MANIPERIYIETTIVDGVRQVRDAHAARFHYDLDAIFQDIKEQEKQSGRTFVSFPPRKLVTNPISPSTGLGPCGGAGPVSSDSTSLEPPPTMGLEHK